MNGDFMRVGYFQYPLFHYEPRYDAQSDLKEPEEAWFSAIQTAVTPLFLDSPEAQKKSLAAADNDLFGSKQVINMI